MVSYCFVQQQTLKGKLTGHIEQNKSFVKRTTKFLQLKKFTIHRVVHATTVTHSFKQALEFAPHNKGSNKWSAYVYGLSFK